MYKYKKDKASGEYYTDRDPHVYNKLTTGFDKTVFVGLDGAIIPWPKLQNVEMKFVPIYTLGLYKGGAVISYPFKVTEAVVLFYRQTNATSSQQDTIENLKEEYMEEYRQSLEAMSKIKLGENSDGLADNPSTLGELSEEKIEEEPEVKEEVVTPKRAPPRKTLK